MSTGKRPPVQPMPSNRKQLNVRLDHETEERVARLLPVISESIGLQLTQSDLVRLAMIALEREYADKIKAKDKKK